MPNRTLEKMTRDALRPDEIASMQSVVEAVCDELGVKAREAARRKAVAERIMSAYRRGTHMPLNLVSAGLAENGSAATR